MTIFKVQCPRCRGRGYIIEKGAAYEQVFFGGRKTTCPRCGGQGFVLKHDPGGFVDLT